MSVRRVQNVRVWRCELKRPIQSQEQFLGVAESEALSGVTPEGRLSAYLPDSIWIARIGRITQIHPKAARINPFRTSESMSGGDLSGVANGPNDLWAAPVQVNRSQVSAKRWLLDFG